MKRDKDYKKNKAILYEVIQSECPHCGGDYRDDEPGWRDKPQDDGLSFNTVRCQKPECGQYFYLDFNQEFYQNNP